MAEEFLKNTKEEADLNQYWYSKRTINALADEAAEAGESVAFLSTPSIFFSMKPGRKRWGQQSRQGDALFDYDRQWESEEGFCFYDFNHPEGIPQSMQGCFDAVVVDPPFITEDVWRKYATAVRFCLRQGGKVLLTTIAENYELLQELFGDLNIAKFMPSIPTLPYQYRIFLNYSPVNPMLSEWNDEIPREFESMQVAKQERRSNVGADAQLCSGGKLSFEELIERELAKEAAAKRQ
ncbi:hypothetical protein GUITHDRAFT_146140 [Guillardia theta CCMP2712]|uniref:N6-adenine methyltransferase n=1 Tax=Guillardia theta (strain CCMP2712) TaxID=905079 RepID=L1IIB5_GUITC|nr:hypothetical protein GUITHDRAFT_146140 [Guillardia theta CCMP2712]EKX35998.1 hypothetical protein GUITHDRAFT_146140 [Guillardia theta CCMP2712]|mmetsp:Transcript_20735/g.69270  ORF Transcript_20735/g.69270 Transcript_20735/m.69270 type:complete len:237 (-) Transcript_20735:2076-2786(-)|eukprot:XP_005822978.1 hypothetical protein GUITHDRAFT_146140 [Guillardia theta CCMP2712]